MRSTTIVRSSYSASARNPTRPRFTPSSGIPAARAISAPRNTVPSPPRTTTSSTSSAAPIPIGTAARSASDLGRWWATGGKTCASVSSSGASPASTRTPTPAAFNRATAARAASNAACRPVWTTISTVRSPCPIASVPRPFVVVGLAGPGRTLLDGPREILLAQRRRIGPQPQEVLDVAGRPGQRAGGHAAYSETELRSRGSHIPHRLGVQRDVTHHAAGAQALLADLELRLDHQRQIRIRNRARGQRREHQPQ